MDHQAPQREFELSASTSPIHPGQLQELSNLLNQGHLPSPCLTPLEFRQGYEGLILFILCLKK